MALSNQFRNNLIAAIPGLRAFGISLTSRADRVDDLVQETLMKAWKHHDSFQPRTNIKALLFTILRNEFYSQHRKRSREVEDADGIYSGRVAVQAEQHSHLDMADLKIALQQLPDDQREAIILVRALGFSYEEAAEIWNVAIGTIKSRVNGARNKLGELLEIKSPSDFNSNPQTQSVLSGSAFADE